MRQDAAARMMQLFAGYDGAFGTYAAEDKNEAKGGKLEIKRTARTVREPVTEELWRAHLEGDAPLGVIPVRADGTCSWGCVDVDKYDVSHAHLAHQLAEKKIPMLVCRSKSGGAHLFLFVSEPQSAADVRARLRMVSTLLGLGECEVFPKQNTVLFERGDLANWLNMPYLGGDESTRCGVKSGGGHMTLSEFLHTAEAAARRGAEWLHARAPRGAKDDGPIAEGPPCLQHLAAEGFPEGARNNGLMALGVYAKKRWPDGWQEQLERLNHELMRPPLPADEVTAVVRGLEKKDYQYRCKDQPIVAHCDSALCRVRRFGVGDKTGTGGYPNITSLSVLDTDPPLWFADVEEQRLELTSDELLNYRRFQQVAAERIHVCYLSMKNADWIRVISSIMTTVTRIDAPPDVGKKAQFQELLEDFLVNRQRGRVKEDLLTGRPWEDEETGRHYFRLRDLVAHLEQEKFLDWTRGQLTERVRALGGGTEFFNLRGRGVNCWYVPASAVQQTPTVPPPALPREPI